MKKTACRFLCLFAVFAGIPLCASAQEFSEPPIATNTINAVKLSELNLRSSDYELLQQVTETAVVSVDNNRRGFVINCDDENFMLKYKYVKEGGKWYTELSDWDGVVKLGYLSNNIDLYVPNRAADVAKGLALYRLISTASQMGADGIVEPMVSMNVAKSGKTIYFKTTVMGRMIRLKTTK